MAGRVRSVRQLGSKLMFLDIERDMQRLQIMVDLNKLEPRDHLIDDFKSSKKTLRIGDWVCKWYNFTCSCAADFVSHPRKSHANIYRTTFTTCPLCPRDPRSLSTPPS